MAEAGADIDNETLVALHHCGNKVSNHVQNAMHVDIEYVRPVLSRNFPDFEAGAGTHPGVVNQNIYLVPRGSQGFRPFLDSGLV